MFTRALILFFLTQELSLLITAAATDFRTPYERLWIQLFPL
jgi:hypothetical protein